MPLFVIIAILYAKDNRKLKHCSLTQRRSKVKEVGPFFGDKKLKKIENESFEICLTKVKH